MFGLVPFRTNKLNGRGDVFQDFLSDFFNDDFFAPLNTINLNQFNVDVRETQNEYLVCAELPGVKKEDINLDFRDNQLIISAKREEFHDSSKDSYVRRERSYGEFSRVLNFNNVDNKNIAAKFENGELKIILPKEIKGQQNSSKIFIQ